MFLDIPLKFHSLFAQEENATVSPEFSVLNLSQSRYLITNKTNPFEKLKKKTGLALCIVSNLRLYVHFVCPPPFVFIWTCISSLSLSLICL